MATTTKGHQMTTTAAEFFHGSPAAAPPVGGASVWPYLPNPAHPTAALEPALPVVLHGPANWCKTTALLDSGADVSAIPYGWAGPLGVDLERARPLNAWGNGAMAEYLAPVEKMRLEIAGQVIDLRAYFTPWEHLVLGRDVFDHFRVVFDQRARTFILDPYDS